MSALLLKTAAALGFVIMLIGVLAMAYKKRQPGVMGLFQLMAYHPFGPRRGVAALRVGQEVLVLGVTNTDFKLLRVLDADKVQASPALSAMPPVPAVPEDMLSRLRKIKEGLDG